MLSRLAPFALLVGTLLLSARAEAFSGGRDGGGCPACHGDQPGGYATTRVTAVPRTPLSVGAPTIVDVKVIDDSGRTNQGGFFAAASQDLFDDQGIDLFKSSPTGVSHAGTKALASGWAVKVTPTAEGSVDLTLWGNAVDGNGGSGSGDRPSDAIVVTLPVGPAAPPPADAGAPADAGNAASDAGNATSDAGNAASDAGSAGSDAGNAASDAGNAASDAGNAASDAGNTASDAGAAGGAPVAESADGGCAVGGSGASPVLAAAAVAIALAASARRRR